MSLPVRVRHYFSRPGERRPRLSVADFLQPPTLPPHSSPFGCRFHPIFGNSHFLKSHDISLSPSVNISLYSGHLSLLLSAFSSLPLHSVPSRCRSPLPVLLSQYLYAAPHCNTSLIHTLLHPPSPPFRSRTINAERRAQTEVTCTEHIKEVWLNKSPNVC